MAHRKGLLQRFSVDVAVTAERSALSCSLYVGQLLVSATHCPLQIQISLMRVERCIGLQGEYLSSLHAVLGSIPESSKILQPSAEGSLVHTERVVLVPGF